MLARVDTRNSVAVTSRTSPLRAVKGYALVVIGLGEYR